MRLLPDGLQAHLNGAATTLCWCWAVSRADGVVLGFTDHDNDLTFDDVMFEAASGFTASDARRAVGLNVDNAEIEGALQSGRIADADLADGLYDNAGVSLYRVNWSDVSQRVLLRSGTIGEVTRTGTTFRAEIRGLTHALGQTQGRVYQTACDADLGDARCGVDLGFGGFVASGTVAETTGPTRITSTDLGASSSGWFSFGLLRWIGGANAGRSVQVKTHTVSGGVHLLDLWSRLRRGISAGDTFEVDAGCDKQLATCADKYSNAVNYRGFPHLPGPSYVTFYPNSDDQR